MNARIDDKTAQIETFCDELKQIIPEEFEEYEKNFEKRAACERYFEKIVEAVVDLAYLVIKDAGLKMPEDDKEAFDSLCKAKIITPHLEGRLKDAKGMRNIIAHEYGRVDDRQVFHALTEEILADAHEFVEQISSRKRRD